MVQSKVTRQLVCSVAYRISIPASDVCCEVRQSQVMRYNVNENAYTLRRSHTHTSQISFDLKTKATFSAGFIVWSISTSVSGYWFWFLFHFTFSTFFNKLHLKTPQFFLSTITAKIRIQRQSATDKERTTTVGNIHGVPLLTMTNVSLRQKYYRMQLTYQFIKRNYWLNICCVIDSMTNDSPICFELGWNFLKMISSYCCCYFPLLSPSRSLSYL